MSFSEPLSAIPFSNANYWIGWFRDLARHILVDNGKIMLSSLLPDQITAGQDNYEPTGLSEAALLILTSSGAVNLTGLAGGADGRLILIANAGSFNITLKHQSASSLVANRFFSASGADVVLASGSCKILVYIGSWIII